MRIYWFTLDEYGLVMAGYSINGRRYSSLVTQQAGQYFVSTGSKIRGDRESHWFSEAQTIAYKGFIVASRGEIRPYSQEYFAIGGID